MKTSHRYSPLHVHFHQKNLRAFRHIIETSRSSTDSIPSGNAPGSGSVTGGGPASWQSGHDSIHGHANQRDTYNLLNGKDPMGLTVLHLLCSSTDVIYLPFLQSLLSHPSIDVNIADLESGWTALHRALYVANLPAATLLVARKEIELELRDHEGYTAFDLYNSTVEGTIPFTPRSEMDQRKELFMWGSSRTIIGLRDDLERPLPTRVELERLPSNSPDDKSRFYPVRFKDIAMNRSQTLVVTDEKLGNLRAAGHPSGGRAVSSGFSVHTALQPVQHVASLRVSSVALAQDHALILTTNGEVYSWGLNRFNQLGYPVETTKNVAGQDMGQQLTSKRVLGPLAKEAISGIAACKVASVSWTSREVFTWGTNRGQLGYSKTSHPVQVLPRKVTPILDLVASVAISDAALCVLLETKEIICFTQDTYFKLSLQLQPFPADIRVTFPPSVAPRRRYRNVEKLTCSEDTFAIISEAGDVFLWTMGTGDLSSSAGPNMIKPQRVWLASRQLNAATDVSLGLDGTLVICTVSGHAYVRSKASKVPLGPNSKHFSFRRIPVISRVVKVAVSLGGTFAALSIGSEARAITHTSRTLGEDFSKLLGYLGGVQTGATTMETSASRNIFPLEDDAADDESISRDLIVARNMYHITGEEPDTERVGPYAWPALRTDPSSALQNVCGGDIKICAQKLQIDAHTAIFSARCPRPWDLLQQTRSLSKGTVRVSYRHGAEGGQSRLSIEGVHDIAVLLLLQYLYTDDVAAIWDHRVSAELQECTAGRDLDVVGVKSGLLQLAKTFEIPNLVKSLEGVMKIRPIPSLRTDMQGMTTRLRTPNILADGDLFIELSDRTIACHSPILRTRSLFFQGLLDDPDWTSSRKHDMKIPVDLRHIEWRVMQFVIRHIYCGEGEEIFENDPSLRTADDLLDFVFAVFAVANELLIKDLILSCSRIIIRHMTIQNACGLLRDSRVFYAQELMDIVQHYITLNAETLLQVAGLDELDAESLAELSGFVRREQTAKHPISRSNQLVQHAMRKWSSWLSLQDLPPPYYARFTRYTFKPSPATADEVSSPGVKETSSSTENMPQLARTPDGDNDPLNLVHVPHSLAAASSPPTPAPWKAKSIPRSLERYNLKSIMENQRQDGSSEGAKGVGNTAVFNSGGETPLPNENTNRSPKKWALRERRSSQPTLDASLPKSLHVDNPSPWRPVPKYTTSSLLSQEALRQPPDLGPSPKFAEPSALSRSLKKNQPPVTATATNDLPDGPPFSHHDLGPRINPIRLSSFGNITVTSKKSNAPWSGAATSPTRQHIRPTKSGSPTADFDKQPKKKSLADIQTEEADQGAQADFELWWAQEAARIQKEEDALIEAVKAASLVGTLTESGKKVKPRVKKRPSQQSDRTRNERPSGRSPTLAIPIGHAGGVSKRT